MRKHAYRLVALVATGAVLVACSGTPSDPGTARVDPTKTLCIEWSASAKLPVGAPDVNALVGDVTAASRLATAQWLLPVLGAKDTSSAFAGRFANNITTACQPDGMLTISDIAASLATLDTADFN